jgi:hypothetical protein
MHDAAVTVVNCLSVVVFSPLFFLLPLCAPLAPCDCQCVESAGSPGTQRARPCAQVCAFSGRAGMLQWLDGTMSLYDVRFQPLACTAGQCCVQPGVRYDAYAGRTRRLKCTPCHICLHRKTPCMALRLWCSSSCFARIRVAAPGAERRLLCSIWCKAKTARAPTRATRAKAASNSAQSKRSTAKSTRHTSRSKAGAGRSSRRRAGRRSCSRSGFDFRP